MERELINYLPKQKIDALISKVGSFDKEATRFYISDSWSMHELIIYLLSFSGPADIILSSFSVSEEAVRAFVIAKQLGYIKSIKVLFDYTTKKHKVDFVNFLKNVTDNIRTYPNHSKTVLIKGADRCFSVVSSQNLNRNSRVECGAISTLPAVYTELFDILNGFWLKSNPLWS